MRRFLSYLILLLPLFLGRTVFAQDDRWDRALDRYEDICNQCILLRGAALQGEEISMEELSGLLQQLSSLRADLQDGSGTMSLSQRERFDRIRKRYRSAMGPGSSPHSDKTVLRLARPQLRLPDLHAFPSGGAVLSASARSGLIDNGKGVSPEYPTSGTDPKPGTSFGIIALGGYTFSGSRLSADHLSYGAMLSVCKPRLGAYLKGRSTFSATAADYTCRSDGTSDGGPIWTSGRTRRPFSYFGAGIIWPVFRHAGFYGGAGYGASDVLWEDAGGKWARVEDYSVKGIGGDVGLVFGIGPAQALVGLNCIGIKLLSLEFGIGIRF